MRSRIAALLLIGLLALAGCAAKDPGPAQASATSAPASATVGDGAPEDTGVLRGLVVDDETVPIPGATVGLTKLDAEVKTDEQGRFEFLGVPLGKTDIVAAKLGYDSVSKRVDVVAGEPMEITLALQPLAVDEAYVEIQPHTAIHHFGATQWVTWAVNLTGNVDQLCSGCVWFVRGDAPDVMFIEFFGKHATSDPQGDSETFWLFRNHYDTAAQVGLHQVALPGGSVTYTQEQLGEKVKVWWAQILCDDSWFCLEEKRDMFVSLFHGYEEVPEGYSVMPKA